jgi:C-terminal processing protease CtpA/Prc
VQTYTPPMHTYTPPTPTYTPPVHTYTPPVQTYTPPVHTYTPPAYTPPAISPTATANFNYVQQQNIRMGQDAAQRAENLNRSINQQQLQRDQQWNLQQRIQQERNRVQEQRYQEQTQAMTQNQRETIDRQPRTSTPGNFGGAAGNNAIEFGGPLEQVRITRVTPGTQAARQGVRSGDVVLSYDGEPVTSVAQLGQLRAQELGGNPVRTVELLRGEEVLTIQLTPGLIGWFVRAQ